MEGNTENKSLVKQAVWYARHGWAVFPLHSIENGLCTCRNPQCKSAGKHPLTPHGVLDASKDIDQIKKWWLMWPWANIGIATGKISGIVVIDVDPRHGGEETLDTLQEEHSKFPDTPVVLTGGGGKHFYFAYPSGIDVNNKVNLGPGIDVRSDGGYVVAPRSLHVSGRTYEWEASSTPTEVPLAPLPKYLLTLLSKTAQRTHIDPLKVLQGVKEGERDVTLFKYACRLRAQGVSRAEAEILVTKAAANCIPPFPRDEAVRKVEQAWKYAKSENPLDASSLGWEINIKDVKREIGDSVQVTFYTDMGEISLSAPQLLTSLAFRKEAVNLNIILPAPKQKNWEQWIQGVLDQAKTVYAPGDLVTKIKVEDILINLFRNAELDSAKHVEMMPVISENGEEYWITWPILKQELKSKGEENIDNRAVAKALASLGGQSKRVRITGGHQHRIWAFNLEDWNRRYYAEENEEYSKDEDKNEKQGELPIPF